MDQVVSMKSAKGRTNGGIEGHTVEENILQAII